MKLKIAILLMLTALLVPSPPAFGLGGDHKDYVPGSSISHPDNWPPSLVELASLPSRVAGYYINSDDYLAFKGDTAGFQAFLGTCVALGEFAATTLHIHKGKGSFQPLAKEKKAVPCDWQLDVMNQEWRSTKPDPKGPMKRLELHVWLDGAVDLAAVKVPPSVKTTKENDQPAAGQAAVASPSDRELRLEQQLMKTKSELNQALAAQATLAKNLEVARQAAAAKGKPEASPIKSLQLPADDSPQTIAAAAKMGEETAAADIKSGTFRILEYGQPRLIKEDTKDPQTGFRIQPVAGCKINETLRAEADAYNQAMREWHAKNPTELKN